MLPRILLVHMIHFRQSDLKVSYKASKTLVKDTLTLDATIKETCGGFGIFCDNKKKFY